MVRDLLPSSPVCRLRAGRGRTRQSRMDRTSRGTAGYGKRSQHGVVQRENGSGRDRLRGVSCFFRVPPSLPAEHHAITLDTDSNGLFSVARSRSIACRSLRLIKYFLIPVSSGSIRRCTLMSTLSSPLSARLRRVSPLLASHRSPTRPTAWRSLSDGRRDGQFGRLSADSGAGVQRAP